MIRKKQNPWLGVVALTCFSVLLLGVGGHGLYQDHLFAGQVTRTTATIERLWTTTGSKGGIHYHTSYRYEADDHVYSGGNVGVSPQTYGQLSVGRVVPIKLLLNRPTTSRIDWPEEDEWHWRQDLVPFVLGLIMAAIGIGIGWAARHGKFK